MIAHAKKMGILRGAALVAPLCFTGPANQADAQLVSALCKTIEAKLQSIDKVNPDSPFSRDAELQRRKVEALTVEADSSGCGQGNLPFLSSGDPTCQGLRERIERETVRLNLIEQKARARQLEYAERQRGQLIDSLEQNGCVSNPRNLPEPLDNAEAERRLPALHNRVVITGTSGQFIIEDSVPYGSYRTMCVRTCDGYYFPISYSRGAPDFGRDESICQAMCPGTQVELYYHALPGQESEEMISLAGERYMDHPNALRYRSQKNVSDLNCRCATATGSFEILGQGMQQYDTIIGEYGERHFTVDLSEPDAVEENDPAQPPFAPKEAELPVEKKKPVPKDATGSAVNRIRVVGPTFLPDQLPAAGAQVQDPPADQ